MTHSRGSGYGENIYGSMGMAVYGRTAADAWYKEVRNYRYGSGFSMNTGHFTQVVWKGSTRMGVGRATNSRGWTYVVANYYPPGNMQGAFTANVLRPGNYNIPTAASQPTNTSTTTAAASTSTAIKTGLEGELCDIVSKAKDIVQTESQWTAKSISDSVFQYLETKKPESLWMVGVVRGSKHIWLKDINGFRNWDLGAAKDRDFVVLEFKDAHDEAEANETVLNEAWRNKVKLAYLEAQRVKESAKEVGEKADEIFPEMKSFQRIIFYVKNHGGYKWNKNPKLFYFAEKVGDWLVVIVPHHDKTGLKREVCGIVHNKGGEPVKSIAESVYKHLEAKKPDSLWLVLVLSGCKNIAGKENLVKAFWDWDLGKAEDKDLVVLEFEKPHDKVDAEENVLNEDWQNKVKLAFLEAQRGNETTAVEVLKKADELFIELKDYQRIIFKRTDSVGYQLWRNTNLFYFYQIVGDWLVLIVLDPTKVRKTGLAKEICDIVNTKGEDTVKSIAESVYNHLEAKKPDSLWIVGISSNCVKIGFKDWISGFSQYNLGDKEDKDCVVFEFQQSHDEVEANATVLNEDWQNKVKLAFLEAQNGREEADEIIEKADDIFSELKSYQRIIFKTETGGFIYVKSSPQLFSFHQFIGKYYVLIIPKPENIGLEEEVCDIVNKKGGETLKCIADIVYKHLETKQPQSLWIVGVFSGTCGEYAKDNLFDVFFKWNLGNTKDKNLVVFDFQHPHDEAKAKETVLNDAWTNKVKLAFLEAQIDMKVSVFRSKTDPPGFKDQTDLVLEKADKLFPELTNYQRIIFRIGDNFTYKLVNSDKIFCFCQVIGHFLVVVAEPPKAPETDEVESEDSALSSHLDNLQLNDEPTGIVVIVFLN